MHGGPRHESCSSGFLRGGNEKKKKKIEKENRKNCFRPRVFNKFSHFWQNSPLSAVAGARWDRAPAAAAAAGLREGRRGGRASPPPAEATQAAHRRRRRRARRPALRTQALLRTRALKSLCRCVEATYRCPVLGPG